MFPNAGVPLLRDVASRAFSCTWNDPCLSRGVEFALPVVGSVDDSVLGQTVLHMVEEALVVKVQLVLMDSLAVPEGLVDVDVNCNAAEVCFVVIHGALLGTILPALVVAG